MTKDLDIKKVMVFCDSQLVVNKITDTFEARGPRMVAYLQLTKDLASFFESFQILHVLCEANVDTNRLARISSG